MNKSFRGLIQHNKKQQIRLKTNNGLQGYRIVKFQLIANTPAAANYENVVKIFTVEPSTIDATLNFDDPTLLGAAYAEGNASTLYSDTQTIIFDNMTFNQDIYVTHSNADGTAAVNYYIELEPVKLDINQATVATLKDMRGRE